MSAATPCVPCCSTPQSVNIPGLEGLPGNNGINGQSAFTITTADINPVPAVGAPVTVLVGSTTWMVVGEILIIGQGPGAALVHPGPGTFQLVAINSPSSMTVNFLGYANDLATPGSIISSGAYVTPAGVQSTAFPTTTKGDLVVDNGALSPNPHPVRLAVGFNGQSVFADSTVADGLGWRGGTQTLNVQTAAVGNGADNTEDTLMSFSVPANTLIRDGDSLEFECVLTCDTTGDQKQTTVYFGATSIIQTAAAYAQNGGRQIIRGRIVRTGANAQKVYAVMDRTDAAGVSTMLSSYTTAAEALAGAVVFKTTGKSPVVASANELVQQSSVLKYAAV